MLSAMGWRRDDGWSASQAPPLSDNCLTPFALTLTLLRRRWVRGNETVSVDLGQEQASF